MMNDAFYRHLFEIMPTAAVIAVAGKIAYANPATMRLLDIDDKEHIIGRPLFEFVHPMDQARSMNRLNRTETEWENAPSQFRLRALDGNMKMLLSASVAIRYEEQDAVLITGLDMTEHAEMAEQLRVSEKNFRRLFDNMQDVYYLTDAKGIVQMVGPGVRSVLGYEPHEIEGKTALTVLSKPVSRRDFILGKFVGIAWTVAVMFVMFGAVMLVTVTYKTIYDAREYSTDMDQVTWQVCHNEMMQTIPGLFLAYMETLVLTALSVAISTRLPMLANFIISFSLKVAFRCAISVAVKIFFSSISSLSDVMK